MIKLRVHCWGGLGSQLYCLALAIDLLNKFPSRKVHILFHTGGITYRKLELVEFPERISFTIIDDFNKPLEKYAAESKSGNTLKKTFKKLIFKTRFIAAVDTTLDFKNLKPWVISIRGHYSHRFICDSTLKQMDRILKPTCQSKSVKNINASLIAIQYRLGDLLAKKKSSIVNVDNILSAIVNLMKFEKLNSVDVFSDSNPNELNNLYNVLKPFHINYIASDPLNTIYQIRNYGFFIGTNSKISIWSIIFRLKDDVTSTNYCPKNIIPILNYNLGNLDKAVNLKTF